MINRCFYTVVVLGTMLLSACSMEKTEQNVIEDKTAGDKVIVDNSNSSTELTLFALSAKEEEVYSNFQKDLNLKHLSELEPISIAKLYVKAEFDKKYDVVYALYTDREGHVQWSKEEDEEIPESHRSSDEQIVEQFKDIDKGRFIQTNDDEGYIEYNLDEGTKDIPKMFKMIKNVDGVWQVAFKPIQ